MVATVYYWRPVVGVFTMHGMNWLAILTRTGVRADVAQRWAPVFAAEITAKTFSLGLAEVDDFLGQVLHESAMLTRTEENLNYTTAERICAVWPSRFRTLDDAEPFVRNPAGLANRVYAGRMGNTDPGDGWRYRGRGLLQVTGRDNYRATGKVVGMPLEKDPDLLLRPELALRVSIAWWEGNIPDAVVGDIRRVTSRVNGGTHGLGHRAELTRRAGEGLA